MSDLLRISSPLSSSPGRSTIIARPSWPWQVTSSRPFVSGASSSPISWDQRSSLLGSSRSATRSPGVNSSSGSITWQPTPTSRNSISSVMGGAGTSSQDDTTRQWSFMGFEWVVRDVHKLKDYVERGEAAEDADFEILKQSPMLGDNKFKLEIVMTQSSEGSTTKPALSLYISSMMVDYAHSDYELSASMMTAIKCQADRPGERGAPAEWVWEFWQMDWVFRQEHEVWECPLPPLSVLLENPRIRDTDSLVICVQIHCPSGPSFPQQPSVYSVPRDLLDGLEASLDNPNTGDVRFVCLEKLCLDTQASPNLHPSDATSMRSSSSASSCSPFSARTTARKRIIYAHSDILIRRSEYFATMLSSSFSENPTLVQGERKLYTIVVEEADFETIYWLLKFCYANWLLFKEDDDPRAAVDGVGVGWSAKWLNSQGGEWDWKTFRKGSFDEGAGDAKSATSGESLLSTSDARTSTGKGKQFEPGTTPTSSVTPNSPSTSRPSPKMALTPTSTRQSTSSSRRVPPASTSNPLTLSMGSASSIPRTKTVPIPITTTKFTSPSHSGYPISPRTGRPHTLNPGSAPDPHPHPTPAPRPASALSMYQIAHRYSMPGLATLALEHMMNTITPQSSFALLLATSVWDELHGLIEDYVTEKWDEVSVSEEFEKCCQEVAAGEWGSEGGKTLMSIFRRLRSPSTMT